MIHTNQDGDITSLIVLKDDGKAIGPTVFNQQRANLIERFYQDHKGDLDAGKLPSEIVSRKMNESGIRPGSIEADQFKVNTGLHELPEKYQEIFNPKLSTAENFAKLKTVEAESQQRGFWGHEKEHFALYKKHGLNPPKAAKMMFNL